MAFEGTQFQDCITISKKFERGAAYSVTEESVYALMTPILGTMRTQARTFVNQTEASENLSTPMNTRQQLANAGAAQAIGNEVVAPDLHNLDLGDEGQDFFTRIGKNFFPDTGNINDLGGIFDSECIPCGFRLDTHGQLIELAFSSPLRGLSEYLQMWEKWLTTMLNQLLDLIGMFSDPNQLTDVCALIRFLNDFVCIPDLQRMLSALMVLSNKSALEINGIFDLILQLVGPLLAPFLSSIIGSLEAYLLMIIRPLECIIDSLQAILAKLDYNVLFQNISKLDSHVSLGPKQGARLPGTFNDEAEATFRKDDPRGPIKVPFIDAHIPRRDIVDGPRLLELDGNLLGPVGSVIKAENAENQAAVEKAASELAAIRRAGKNVDGANPDAVAKHREKEQAAAQKYRNSIEERDLSAVGRVNLNVDRTISGLKSSLLLLIGFIREAVQTVEAFLNDIFGEFKKIMGEYLGGSNGFIGMMIKKMAIVKLISLIASIIDAFEHSISCGDENEQIRVENFIPQQQGMNVWTDETGNIHIEGDSKEIDDAINNLVATIGFQPSPDNQSDNGTPPTTMQKLNSLIEFTGDPVLDTQIARAVDGLTRPLNVIFKCPLQTTVVQATQVNQWIQELNT